METTIGYLGPDGSYSHEVAMHIGAGLKLVALEPSKFAQALRERRIQQAVLPVVNGLGGQVEWALKLLRSNNGSYPITREIIWRIQSHLIGFGRLDEVKMVCSHSQPLDQCQRFLGKMPGITTQGMASTSAAVEFVAGEKAPEWAAIGTDYAAQKYGVPIIARNLSGRTNKTRFIILGGEKTSPTGSDRTSILVGTANKPGALLRVLEVFDALAINMSALLSMPAKNGKLGEFLFLIDVDGHQEDEDLRVALKKIVRRATYLKVLGSYPRVSRAANRTRKGESL